MSINSNIVPYTITTVSNVVSFSVTCRELILFTTAMFIVTSYDINNNQISCVPITLTTEQYLAWNNDDDYILTLIASILGYTIEN